MRTEGNDTIPYPLHEEVTLVFKWVPLSLTLQQVIVDNTLNKSPGSVGADSLTKSTATPHVSGDANTDAHSAPEKLEQENLIISGIHHRKKYC
jgi:hypothetical protein